MNKILSGRQGQEASCLEPNCNDFFTVGFVSQVWLIWWLGCKVQSHGSLLWEVNRLAVLLYRGQPTWGFAFQRSTNMFVFKGQWAWGGLSCQRSTDMSRFGCQRPLGMRRFGFLKVNRLEFWVWQSWASPQDSCASLWQSCVSLWLA